MTLSSILSRRLSFQADRAARVLIGLSVILFAFASSADRVVAQSASPAEQSRVMHNGLAPIAPFINKNTLVAVRIDVDRIDYDAYAQTINQAFEQLLKNVQFDEQGVQACQKEFAVTAEVLKSDLQTAVADFKAKTGVSDVYFIMQTTRGDGACFIAPVKDLTKEQQNECKKLAEKFHLNCELYQKSFMVATQAPLKDFGAYYKDFQASANQTLENAIAKNGDKLVSWYCGRLKIRPLFHATLDEGPKSARVRQYDPFANAPRSVKDLVEAFDASFVEASGYVDASTLSVRYSLKFTTSVNASKFHDALVDVIDAYNAFYFKKVESNPLQVNHDAFAPGKSLTLASQDFVKQYNVYGIAKEFFAGNFQSFVPRQDEDQLIFDDNAVAEVAKLGPNSLGILALGYNLLGRNSKVDVKEVESAVIEFEDDNESGDSSKAEESGSNPFKRID